MPFLKLLPFFDFLFTRAQGTQSYYAQSSQFAKTTNYVWLLYIVMLRSWLVSSAGFTYRLYRLEPRALKFKGASNKLVWIESMAGIWSFRSNFVKIYVFNYDSRNSVLFDFRGDNASVLQRVSMNIQHDGWSSRMPTIVSIYSKHVGCVLRLLNSTDWFVWLSQKTNLWLLMFEMHLISGITNR